MINTQEYLSASQVADYLKSKGIFKENAVLEVRDLHAVKESIDGFVNLIYHVKDENGKSVVLKQIVNLPRSRAEEEAKYGESEDRGDWTLDIGRMRVEISVLIFWNSIARGICPDIYLFDEAQNVIVMEDLTDLSLLRYDLCRMKKNDLFAERMGRFFARNLFFSSDLHLTSYKRKALLSFFENPEYTALEAFLFERCVIVSNERTMPQATWAFRQQVIGNERVQDRVKALHRKFSESKECLIHTDLHASNIMVNADKVKIIDTEFAGFGPIAQDLGRLMASLCLNFISWIAPDPEHTEGERAVFRGWVLDNLEALFNYFEEEFRLLVQKYQSESYSIRSLDVDAYLLEHLRDAVSYAALNAASRVSDRGLCHDIARLEPEDRIYPSLLVLKLASDLLEAPNKFKKISDLSDYLRVLAFHCPPEYFDL
ncbi:MAG: phosphotransferase [Eubacterium sp.]|nr:phosphotransferase [Eubacterium sp.]